LLEGEIFVTLVFDVDNLVSFHMVQQLRGGDTDPPEDDEQELFIDPVRVADAAGLRDLIATRRSLSPWIRIDASGLVGPMAKQEPRLGAKVLSFDSLSGARRRRIMAPGRSLQLPA